MPRPALSTPPAMSFMAARLAFVEATHAVAAARQTLDLVSEAHDAMAILYEADNELAKT